jgi:hypothetical protein
MYRQAQSQRLAVTTVRGTAGPRAAAVHAGWKLMYEGSWPKGWNGNHAKRPWVET